MCCVPIGDAGEAALAAKFAVMRPFPDGAAGGCTRGTGADQPGCGGVGAVARAAGSPRPVKPPAARGSQAARQPDGHLAHEMTTWHTK
jgi:hypothetical protein